MRFVSVAQHFGGHPVSMKWSQINTDSIRIIFPAGLEKQAQSIARITHSLPFVSGKSIGTEVKKIDVVLQPYSTISNGYVALGPRRSEFLLTPLQNSFQLGSIPWHQSLALHEYRHIQQYNNFRKGASKAFYYLFGQQGQELANNAAVPNWFWEGDAVLQETMLTIQGRGRLPWFYNGFRSLDAAGKSYSWMKLRNGSLRDYTPDHYQLGYQLVVYGREQYGEEFWQRVTDDAVRFRGLFYPFQRAVKKHAGISFRKFRVDALQYFRDSVFGRTNAALAGGTDAIANQTNRPTTRNKTGQTLISGSNSDPATLAAKNARHFIADEEFQQWIDSVQVVYVHSSYKQIPSFRIRNVHNGKERELRKRDITLDQHFSYNNGKIVYAAYEPDTRWGWRDYSDIRLLDISTGKQQSLTHHDKYFSPDINRAGNMVVAVHAGNDGSNSLHFLSIADESESLQALPEVGRQEGRKELHSITVAEMPNSSGYVLTYPKFFNDQQVAVAARDSLGRMAIALVSMSNGTIETLTPWVNGVMGFLHVIEDTILFTASHGHQDRLFCIVGNKIFLLRPDTPNLVTGSYQPAFNGGHFSWTEFTAAGFLMRTVSKEKMYFEEMNAPRFALDFPASTTIEQQIHFSFSNRSFTISRYRNSFGLVNFHSWRPIISDPEYTFALVSENTLNTLQGELYFTYNRNEQSKQAGFTATYSALFPWIRAGTNYTIDRQARFDGVPVFWNEWEARTGLVVPLNFTGGKYYRNFSAGSDIVLNKRYYKGALKDSFDNRTFAYLNNFINFSNQVQKTRQQINSRWAQTLAVRYSHAVSVLKGKQLMASADWYFPGIAITHSLVLNTAFHLRDTLHNIRFSNSFPFSRGYIGENFHRMIKAGAEYHFPIVYPDWGFASLVYFQRIRADVFYDYTNVFDYSNTGALFRNDYRSFGIELFFDTKWWNQEPVSFGIRYSRLVDGEKQNLGKNQWELILPVNLLRE